MRRAVAALALAVACLSGPALAADGAALYADNCAPCHQAQGQGTAGLAPPLVSGVLKRAGEGEARAYVPQVIIHGMSGPIQVEGQLFMSAMPGHTDLADAEVAAIAAFVLDGLNGLAAQVTEAEVAAWRAAPLDHGALRTLRKDFAP